MALAVLMSGPALAVQAQAGDDADAGVPLPLEAEPVEAEATPPPETEAASTGLEEIVVTAERRKANLQHTPISITALSAETLRQRGGADLRGVAEATPNLQLTTSGNGSGGGNFAQLFIRGVGQPDFIITKDPAVGIYVDGVYLARAPGALLQLLDIERVEVLRGPQGTLFGKNTAGGAISLVTKQPSGNFGGVAQLQLGNYAHRDLSGSFETPLVENKLFLRVSGMARHQDGYYKRLRAGAIDPATANGNGIDIQAGRITLRWAATDDIDITLAADGTLERQTATDYQAVGIMTMPPNIDLYNRVVLQPMGQMYDASYIPTKPWTTYSTSQSYNNSDVWGTSLTFNWDVGPFAIKLINAYRKLRVATKTDADGTPFDIVASDGILVNQHQISNELQFSGNSFAKHLAWVAGLWYFQEHATDRQSSRQLVGLFPALEAAGPRSIAPPGMPADACPPDGSGPEACLGGAGNMANLRFDQTRLGSRTLDGRSYAAFGQLTLKIIEAVRVTAGARLGREEKDFNYFETRPLQNNRVSFDNVKANPGWTVFTPKLGLEVRISDELMAYASFARGFKAGGVNGRPTRPDLFTSFDPEWLTTYEVGAKSDWFEHRLRFNVALFWSRYTDIQITRNTVDMDGAFIRVEGNAGTGNIRGFEAELSAAPVRGMNLALGAGYTHFEFSSLLPQMAPPGTPLLTLNTQLPFTPKLVGNASAAYAIRLGSLGALTPRADLSYSSSYFTDIDNTAAVSQKRYLSLNVRLAYSPPSESWEAYFSITNLTDTAVVASSVASPANGNQIVSYKPPRMFYGGVRFMFD
jgi:iron complex outermembrane recepter protein